MVTAAASPRSVGKAAAFTPFAASAATPTASLSALRATRATEKPSAPNLFATASEMPDPSPHTRMVFVMATVLSLPRRRDKRFYATAH